MIEKEAKMTLKDEIRNHGIVDKYKSINLHTIDLKKNNQKRRWVHSI